MINQEQNNILPPEVLKEPAKKEEEKIIFDKNKLLEIKQISLWLDVYDDIFSDFDPRPYSQRAISDDFLFEVKKFLREKRSGQVEIKFLIPEKERNLETEIQIKKRLKEYFRKHFGLREQKLKESKNKITSLIISGLLMLLSSTSISYYSPRLFVLYLLITLFELGGWLSIWFGLEEFIYNIREKRQEMEFYKKMTKAEIKFFVY